MMEFTPLGWAKMRLLELASIRSGQVDPRRPPYRDMPLIAPNHIETGTGRLLAVRSARDQHAISGKYLVEPGDVIYSKIRPYLMKAHLAQFPALCSADMYALKPRAGVDSRYLVNVFLGHHFTNYAVAESMRSGIPKVNRAALAGYELFVPAGPEQRAIGDALGDTDELIIRLERLIRKKRDVKQGIMQELLTGRTRLPGFTGKWPEETVGSLANVKAGGTPSTSISRYWSGNIRWMSSGEVHQKQVHEVEGRISLEGLRESSAQLFPANTVLIALAGQGRTRGTAAIARVDLTTNQSLAGILPAPTYDSAFLYYNLDSRYHELREASTGDGGRGGLNLKIIRNLEVALPSVDEQRAVGRILLDVDAEIEALERRLASVRAVKVGMMQELLTGRTRLPVEEDT